MPEEETTGTITETVPNNIVSSTPSTHIPLQKRRQLKKEIEHITEEMYKRNRELVETNKTLSLLRTIDAFALESSISLEVVCDQITKAICQTADYPFAALLTRSSRSDDLLELSGWNSNKDKTKELAHLSLPVHLQLSNNWFGSNEFSRLIPIEDLSNQYLAKLIGSHEKDIEKFRHKLPIKSVYIVKLISRHHIVGLIVVGYNFSDQELNPADVLLVDRLSEGIGVALDNKLLLEENQKVLRQLKVSNSKLRALDEAKDDFISMASHQLRTPLTSVKGYISMIKDGDAGKITPTQKDMLSHAFFSSQRMVFLIADMLNVSRLNTGKFIIENVPVNLAEVVEEEIGQLRETAEAHSVNLKFNKPKEFPITLLDETKIRQVIMNFVDNAIYYTHKGGHIVVTVKNNPSTIELTVKDDGMGVPKNERHHLFTKFYRAGNARKVRPDGTGLGLFMAKKVIVAQGGALIFDSTEGKGSTFGFILNKNKPESDNKVEAKDNVESAQSSKD
ncbi:MAG TPA: HAMP domain-containing sensor histidine kinase [Patescibacteria group bacterium]|nr:HAMP domain-containing sensor histidine kinase [Patescibacteria group bacterium]